MGLPAQFHKLFLGLERAYGTYQTKKKSKTGKMEGQARTLQEPVTDDLWKGHLAGEKGLGIVPINDEDECNWAAIDIDIYDGLDHKGVEDTLRKLKIPLLPCTTKSGGLHLYLFMNKPVKARLVRTKMAEWATIIGHGNAEIFPKQDELLDNTGNWINMPYFNANSKGATRYGLKNGKRLSATAFLKHAGVFSISPTELKKIQVQVDSDLDGAPPCIKTLWMAGIPDGMRDKGLFSVGVYLKKKFEGDWEDRLYEFNENHVNPPLPKSQVAKIAKSLTDKDWMYICKDQPLLKLCNKDLCAKEKYGVGSSGPGVELTHLRHEKTPAGESVKWIVNVDGKELELSSYDDLYHQPRFASLCGEKLYKMCRGCKKGVWEDIVEHLLATVEIIAAPEDASETGQFLALFESFVGQGLSRTIDHLLTGTAVIENEHIKFTSGALAQFAAGNKMNITINRMWSILKKRRKAKSDRKSIKGKLTRYWMVPEDQVNLQTDPFDTPDVAGGM